MHQAEVTAAELHDQQIHDIPHMGSSESVLTTKTWGELAEVFETFGLTPQDMNIPWQTSRTPSASGSGNLSRTTTPGGRLKPLTPLLPLDKLNSRSNSEKFDRGLLDRAGSLKSIGRVDSMGKLDRGPSVQSIGRMDSMGSVASRKAMEEEAKKKKDKEKKGKRKPSTIDSPNSNPHIAVSIGDKNRLESKFKSYTPSSWRDDFIQKKAQELSQVM